ncbi:MULTISPECIES: MFS transporter [Sphingobium]|uniref:MFS transporter n=1 Tax=Sphingobium TaxID=165695 RepID=UPI0015EC56A6|nr:MULTISPECIES: MFS transporter [Sphingobium]MCW2362173.1 AAHS family 4-hydroxybenzoate transporter-like MFS transporter [Sphingobium sp. B10D3B]MCW2388366.1 AAHS family 4-hydroxybenzoate transporter-like MFS transporter [Sphingobium sp. B11D3B]MCW2401148.1 AAHS family 4-hydroxybenzoate transporter-like MFS transporter [Sphingobium sp. B10D7B]MCW2408128.1 AAHS family 4-hydroxybenzoate transporter-like MFS transporter [Sphingobium xanthum]
MNRFDVEDFIDRSRISATQIMALLVCVLVCFIDGFDIFMIGKIAPAIAADFGETSEAMTKVFVYQQIGLAIGAFSIAPLADRFGRRFMLMVSCLIFGTITIGSIHAQTLTQLAVLRGIAGVFMAAGLPMAMALISELTPKRKRSTLISLALVGFSTGSAASGVVAAWLLDSYGWESGFWIGGLVPITCAVLLFLIVPESLKFRAERNPSDQRIATTIRKIDRNVDLRGDELFVIESGGAKGRKAKLSDVFSEGRLTMTALVWAACTLSMTNTALLSAWMPTFFLEMSGIPIQDFAKVAMIGYLGGVAGTLSIGWLMDRMRPALLIACFYVMLAVTINLLGWVPFYSAFFVVALLTWQFFQTGGQSGLNTMIAQVYPPRMRSTALGWAGGAGRIGGIVAPIAGGFALAQHYSLQLTLALTAALPLGTAILMFALAYIRRQEEAKDREPVTLAH